MLRGRTCDMRLHVRHTLLQISTGCLVSPDMCVGPFPPEEETSGLLSTCLLVSDRSPEALFSTMHAHRGTLLPPTDVASSCPQVFALKPRSPHRRHPSSGRERARDKKNWLQTRRMGSRATTLLRLIGQAALGEGVICMRSAGTYVVACTRLHPSIHCTPPPSPSTWSGHTASNTICPSGGVCRVW
jgi:hypothetical protein